MRKMSKHFLFACVGTLALTILVHAQSQTGFISIDCGMADNSSYTDQTTGLNYLSDTTFTDSGVSKSISTEYRTETLEQQFWNVRSFPEGEKNCYTLKPAQGKGYKYLIRARFMHGNYDDKGITMPIFDLYLGANKWDSVKLENASSITTMEIIHIPPSKYLHVCLVNTGHGTPFISALELRPLKNSTYTPSESAVLYRRLDVGSQVNQSIRYKDDVYDRLWMPFQFLSRKVLSTDLSINTENTYQPPSLVMATAMAPENASGPFSFFMRPANPTAQYYVYLHFAEVEKLEANQSREFNIYQNGEFWNGPISLDYLAITTISSTSPVSGERIDYDFYRTETSTHPPILNALEAYIVVNSSESLTDERDVDAMMNIKSKYGVKKNWQGDPCALRTYMWGGLNCSYGDESVRVVSLNLSSSGLTGEIASDISDLTMIQYLDLSNNSLTGSVPDFLSKLQLLKVLDLRGNKLTGSVPAELIEKSNSGSLSLSVSGNSDLCSSLSCQKKKHKYIVPVIASVVAAIVAILIALAIGWTLKRRRDNANKAKSMRRIGSELEPQSHQFSYSEIMTITNNFEKVIGIGGFGTVFHGYINNTQVAVKMLSSSSAQGYKEFHAEVKLLLRVHHRNLTNLIGYCYEESHMGLIYEYMANGNLGSHLSDKNAYTMSWEDRLRIAVDAAQGLEYLHHGCKPPIVHRDVKPANILLTEKFQAKLADFGLSKAFPTEGSTHVSTVVAGTPGYLDPEYFVSNWLNEKSDVYSFGVVLLEIITSRSVLQKNSDNENSHLSQWVSFMLGKGEIDKIVDPRLRGDFKINSAWKAVEIAIACLSRASIDRPTMNQVVIELKECLELEIAPKQNGHEGKDTLRMMTLNLDSDLSPSPK
ncbi:hypothetical protein UlMin_014084 [Ulmus minor]